MIEGHWRDDLAVRRSDAVATEVAPYRVTCEVTGSITHLCPFVDETDIGTVTIAWTTRGRTLELHALAAYLATFARVPVSHEDLCKKIKDQLGQINGIGMVQVRYEGITAGLRVICTA